MHNLDKKEQIIMIDGEFAAMMQHQEEEEVQKSMEKEQRAKTSTPTEKALLLVKCVLSLHFFKVFHTPELGRPIKINDLGN